MNNHFPKIIFIIITACLAFLFLPMPSPVFAQVVQLDDIQRDILEDNRDRLRSIREERERRKNEKDKEKDKRKKAYEEKIKTAQIKLMMDKQDKIIVESEELLKALKERTKFESDERWRYEQLIKQTAEQPFDTLTPQAQEEMANQLFASATAELVEQLKKKAIEEAKRKRGEKFEEVETSQYLLAKLEQYAQLTSRIKSMQRAQEEKIVKKQESVVESTEDLIEFLKEEAIRRSEAKREVEKEEIEAQRMNFKEYEASASTHYGYDSNINADDSSEGDSFIRNFVSAAWLPSFSEFYKAELGVWYLGDNYFKVREVAFQIWSGYTNFKWFPRGDDSLEIQPGLEISNTQYPHNAELSTQEYKASFEVTHKIKPQWSQDLNYELLWIENNDNRPSRDNTGTDRTGVSLKRRRHSLEHILNFPLPHRIRFKLKQKIALQTSNDDFQDFYDYNSYRITGQAGRALTEKIYALYSLSYERTNFSDRTVSDIQIAQENNTYTNKLNLFYFWKEDWLVNYTWTLTKADSNDPGFDYGKMTHLIGVHYSF